MVSAYEIENALRARNTRLLRRALRLEFDERYDLIKNMPMYSSKPRRSYLLNMVRMLTKYSAWPKGIKWK